MRRTRTRVQGRRRTVVHETWLGFTPQRAALIEHALLSTGRAVTLLVTCLLFFLTICAIAVPVHTTLAHTMCQNGPRGSQNCTPDPAPSTLSKAPPRAAASSRAAAARG